MRAAVTGLTLPITTTARGSRSRTPREPAPFQPRSARSRSRRCAVLGAATPPSSRQRMCMDQIVREVGGPEFTVNALIARWNAPTSRLAWIDCDGPPLMIASADGTTQQLESQTQGALGSSDSTTERQRHERRLHPGQRLILCSDGASITPSARDDSTAITHRDQARRSSPPDTHPRPRPCATSSTSSPAHHPTAPKTTPP